GTHHDGRGHGEVQGLCRPEIDDQFEPRRLLDRNVTGPRALEDEIDKLGAAAPLCDMVRPIGYEATRLGEFAIAVDCRELKLERERSDLAPHTDGERVLQDYETAGPCLSRSLELCGDLFGRASLERQQIYARDLRRRLELPVGERRIGRTGIQHDGDERC